jgi:signal peptidase I
MKARQNKMQKKWREVASWIIYILVVFIVVNLITTYVGQRTTVSGSSMLDTLHDRDNLIVEKVSYYFSEPERFDIIIFPFRHAEDTYYIKRIIGLPGETVEIRDGYVYIDGNKLDDKYGREVIEKTKYGLAREPVVLGEGEYFVLGDNRNDSSDSRDASVGVIYREEIIGKAWLRIWPLESLGFIE